MQVRVLGNLEVVAQGQRVSLGGPKQRTVLALLVADYGRVVPADVLIDGVWGAEAPGGAKGTLQTYISNLRSQLGRVLVHEGGGYRLEVEPTEIDSRVFEGSLLIARDEIEGRPMVASQRIRESLALWRGLPYSDAAPSLRLEEDARRLTELRVTAVEDAIDAELSLGFATKLISELEVLCAEHPLRERFRAQHMLALYRSGRHAEALAAYAKARQYLGEELGVDPSPRLEELAQRILEHDASLLLEPPGPNNVTETDAADAFPPYGRDHSVSSLTAGGLGRMLRGYEIREAVSTGSAGVVYRAFQPSVGREVAIKVLGADLVNRAGFIARFEAEAHLVARLDHPHIIKLYDYWRDPDGAYLVTQWLGGGPLAEWLRRDSHDPANLLRLIEQVADALAYAHRLGVVHGDVRAETVLVDDHGNAYLTEFRVAEGGEVDDGRGADREFAAEVAQDVRGLVQLAAQVLSDGGVNAEAMQDLHGRASPDGPSTGVGSVEDFLASLREAGVTDTTAARKRTPVANPYKGLSAFDESDHTDFHGRDRLVSDLLATLSDRRLVAVVGPSGIGKSSVVRAGLIPALRTGALPGSEHWLITDTAPGGDPFDALEIAVGRVAARWPEQSLAQLASDESGMARVIRDVLPHDAELVIVIDQFEELFTLVLDEEIRQRFVKGLINLVSNPAARVRVVLTVRADYLDAPLRYPRLGDLIKSGMVVVAAPSEDDLIDSIRLPAERVGVDFEPGLVERIIDDVALEPGGLPLLQYALTEMFARPRGVAADVVGGTGRASGRSRGVAADVVGGTGRASGRSRGDTLTQHDYDAAGGVLGAVGARAEALYTDLSASARRVAPDIFLRLVTVDESGRHSRRRALRRELNMMDLDSAAVSEVLDRYGEHRLLTFDRDPTTRSPTVELGHEALIGRWDRYKAWIEARREDLILHERLAGAVREWQLAAEDQQFLLGGGRLDNLEAWAGDTDLGLTEDERRFLAASRSAQDAYDTRRRRIRTAVTAGLGMAALVASGLALVALDSQREALRTEQLATSRELAAAAINVVDQDSELSLLLAIEAIDAAPDGDTPPIEAVSALHEAVRSSRTLLSRSWDQQLPTGEFDAVISPDGDLVAATGGAQTLQVWNSGSGEIVWEMTDETDGGWFSQPRFSPDGSLLVSAFTRYWTDERSVEGGLATGIYLLDPDNGDIVDVLDPTGCPWVGLPMRHAFTADGNHLIRLVDSGDPPDGCFGGVLRLELVDVASGQVTTSVDAVASQAEGVDPFLWAGADPSRGRLLLSDGSAPLGSTRMIDINTGETLWERGSVFGIPSHDWTVVALGATSAAQRSIELVDPESGITQQHLIGHSAEAVDVTFNADSSIAYTAGHDGTARIWDIETGANLLTLTGNSAGLANVSIDDEGRRLVAAGLDHLVQIWDLTERPLGEGMAIALDPAQVATRGIDVANGLVGVSTIEGECPDQVMSGFTVNATSGEIVESFDDFRSQVLALTPDGTRLIHQFPITHGPGIPCHEVEDGPLVVRDTSSGAIVTELAGLCAWVVPDDCAMPPDRPYADFVQGLSVTADGTLAAASGVSRAVSVWDLTTGEVAATWIASDPDVPGYVTGVSLHPEGAEVAVFVMQETGDEVQVTDLEGDPIADFQLAGNANNSGHLAFSPDGSRLAVGGSRLTVVDASTWETTWEADAHDGGVFHLDFSPEGDRIVTTGSDGFVRVWGSSNGDLRHVIPMGDDWAKAVAFADDSHIVVGTLGGLVATLTVDVAELVDIGRGRLTRGLTDQECRTYLHLDACPAR